MKRSLLSFARSSEQNVSEFVEETEKWFNNSMDRVSGWYKRRVGTITLVLGIILSIGLNADSFQVAGKLWASPVLRQKVAAMASQANPNTGDLVRLSNDLEALPIGWLKAVDVDGETKEYQWAVPESGSGWLVKLLGLLATGLLVSLGAPFWFGTLEKIVNIRNAGTKPTS